MAAVAGLSTILVPLFMHMVCRKYNGDYILELHQLFYKTIYLSVTIISGYKI